MEFPISRERLRNIRYEVEEANMKKAIETLKLELRKYVEIYTEEIIKSATYGQTEYVIKVSIHPRPINIATLGTHGRYVTKHLEPMTKQEQHDYIIEQLKLKFPDCEYIIDPLQTYILVRW